MADLDKGVGCLNGGIIGTVLDCHSASFDGKVRAEATAVWKRWRPRP